jgi:PAS domain S-box-containing protein
MLAFSIVLLSLLLLRKDMEGKKIAEDKLMQSEQILNEAQKIAKIGHWEMNVATGTLTISEALNEILNTPDRSSGLSTIENFYKLLSPDESDRLRRELNTCIATGVGYETDYTVVLKNGAQKIISNKVLPQVDEHGKVKVVRGTSQDITESRSFDIALRKSEKRFSTIFHLNPLPAVITRIKDGKILLNNKKASELFGFAATDLEDATTIQLKAWKNIEEKTMIINDPKAKNLVQVENTYHTKLGRVFKAITNIERIEIDGEECMLAIIQDIDDLKKKEESIRNYSMELERLNNNQVKFLAIIAHDLMSPVNGLIGCSNLLEDDTDNLSHDEIKQLSKAINTSSTNLKTLLSNLLAWANNHSGHLAFTPTKLSLEAVVESELLLLKDVLNQKSIQIRKSLPVKCELMADENMLHTILRNFITNAIKFSYSGGVIEILATSEKDRIYISIVDKGVGMEESVQKKLFRIETKNSEVGTFGEKGSGLGLHLCKEFVEMHGGEVFVESERGVGTTFSFSLPGNCEV